MKVIDSMWCSTSMGVFGLVVGENKRGERKLYGGIVSGFDQKTDEQAILDWGSKVSLILLEGLIAKVKLGK